ncbi:hypothetical protein [Mesorhizobium sp.]|uniref:hypothetical protein n=1 Tax=Mesorhizobium sp. TaxID=1871066 RepID=UPI0025FF4E26|nr:hypothetical protein [Mesorhizobium sp.]
MSGKLAQRFDGARRHVWTSAGLDASDTQLRMASAGPMNQQHGLVGRLIEVAHDLLNQDVDEPLLGPGIGRRCVPHCRQIVSELEQTGAIDLWPDLNSCRQIPARFLRYLVVFVEVELGAAFCCNAK